MKILHLPTPTGGNAWGLAQGERSLGLASEVLVSFEGGHHYPSDRNLHTERCKTKLGKLIRLAKGYLSIRNRYDIYHFNYGSSLIHFPQAASFLNQLDLPYYGKKKLYVTYNGCDIRQKYPTMKRTKIAACHEEQCYGGMCNSGKLDEARRRGLAKMQRYVSHIWALNPDLLHFLPKEKSSFLPYTVAHFSEQPVAKVGKGGRLRIVHAPTNRAAKGSNYVIATLNKLQREYPNQLDIQLVEGKSYHDALAIYRSADLVIDQVLIGWYGAFAVETMLMGKPVVARIAEEDLHFIPPKMKRDLGESVINANPSTLEDALRQCIEDRSYLRSRAEACHAYARKWHHPEHVAKLTKEQYERAE